VVSGPTGERLPDFAHPVERELARVFDGLQIRWRYEPHTFVLRRNRQGRVEEAFTPDFYLPDLDFYVECTVAKRRLTRVKRRKVEAARRLHGIMVEIVYRADFEMLARRWSLTGLAAELERTR
jgi:hypothetical protein